MEVMGKLPPDLVKWLVGWLKNESSTRSYVEIDLAQSVNVPILTGDLVIRKHRNPNPRDIIEISLRYQNSNDYDSRLCRVLSVDFKKSILHVEDVINQEITWSLGVNNILCIIDKIIPYGSVEWETSVRILNIDYNDSEIKTWLNSSIEAVEKTENFYEKARVIQQLKERLDFARSK